MVFMNNQYHDYYFNTQDSSQELHDDQQDNQESFQNPIFEFYDDEEHRSLESLDTASDHITPLPIPSNHHPVRFLIAGFVAGAVSRTVTAPLDRFKLLVQTQAQGSPMISSSEAQELATTSYSSTNITDSSNTTNNIHNNNNNNNKYSSISNSSSSSTKSSTSSSTSFTESATRAAAAAESNTGARQGIKSTMGAIRMTDGVRGLWVGNGANVLRIGPAAAVTCLTYTTILDKYRDNEAWNRHEYMYRIASGATAGLVGSFLTYPLDVVRTRLTVQHMSEPYYEGIRDAIHKIVAEEGVAGLFKGLRPTLMAIAPFVAVQHTLFMQFKYLMENRLHLEPSAYTFLTSAATAGGVAQIVVYPLDVMRRRYQVQHKPFLDYTNSSEPQNLYREFPRSVFTGMKQIVKAEGISAMYSGLGATLFKLIPAVAINLVLRDAMLGRRSG